MSGGGLRELVAESIRESGGGGGTLRWAGCLEACLLAGCEVARLCCVAAWGGDAEGLEFVSFVWFGIGSEVNWGFQGWEFRDSDGGSRCVAYGLDSRVRSRVRSLITYHDDGWIMLGFSRSRVEITD